MLYWKFLLDLIAYFVCSSVYLLTPISWFISSPVSPLVTISIFLCLLIYLFLKKSSFVSFFLDSTHKGYHMIFIFLCLTYFTSYDNLWVHPQMAWFHSILGLEPLLNLHEWGIFWQLKAFIQGTATLLVGTTLFVRLAIPEASEWRLSEYPLWTALLSKCRKSVLHLPSKELTRAVMFLGIDHPFQMSTFHYDLQGMVFHKCI